MKKRIAIGIVTTSILSVAVALLENVISNFIQPTTRVQTVVTIVLFVIVVFLSIAANIYFQGERTTPFTRLLQRYTSLWLIVLLMLTVTLLMEIIGWKVVVVASLVFLMNVAAFGYVSTIHERRVSRRYSHDYPLNAYSSEKFPSPYATIDRRSSDDE